MEIRVEKRLRNDYPAVLVAGEVSEWLKEHAWKACVQVTLHQGFESLPLRSLLRYERHDRQSFIFSSHKW